MNESQQRFESVLSTYKRNLITAKFSDGKYRLPYVANLFEGWLMHETTRTIEDAHTYIENRDKSQAFAMLESGLALNIASQCRSAANSEIAKGILIEEGFCTMSELLKYAADVIEKLSKLKPNSAKMLSLMEDFPEINMANYGDDEVKRLNDWGMDVLATHSESIAERQFRTIALEELYNFQEATGCDVASELAPNQLRGYQAQPAPEPITDAKAHEILTGMAEHVQAWMDNQPDADDLSDEQFSGMAIRFIQSKLQGENHD
jgi:hypothetical protein